MADYVTPWSDTTQFINARSPSTFVFPPTYTKALWDAYLAGTHTLEEIVGPAGVGIETGTGAALVDGGALATVELADGFDGVIVGMCFELYDSSNLPNVALGLYEIAGVTSTSIITVSTTSLGAGVGAISGDATVSYRIGGVWAAGDSTAELQDAFDNVATNIDGTTHNVDILYNTPSLAITADINFDNIIGSTTSRAKTTGTNSVFKDDGTKVIIKPGANLFSLFALSANDYQTFKNFDMNGNDGGFDADYCFEGLTSGDGLSNVYENCRMHHATLDGIISRSTGVTIINCEIDNNGRYGINTSSTAGSYLVDNNHIHNNTSHGINWRPANNCVCSNNIIEGNTGDGVLEFTSSLYTTYSNNTIEGNTGAGLNLLSGAVGLRVFNNTSSGNTGLGYDFNHSILIDGINRNNHAFGNSAPSDQAASDALWLALAEGNIVGDPLFEDLIEYIPSSSSPLIDAGVGGTGDTIGALCATAGGGGGGAVNLLTGLIT